jgi:hypothetical protein
MQLGRRGWAVFSFSFGMSRVCGRPCVEDEAVDVTAWMVTGHWMAAGRGAVRWETLASRDQMRWKRVLRRHQPWAQRGGALSRMRLPSCARHVGVTAARGVSPAVAQ